MADLEQTASAPAIPGRRLFVELFAWAGLVASAGMVAWDGLRYVIPPIVRARFRKVFVARLAQLPAEDVLETVDLRGRPVAIRRREGASPLAISLVCTHLGCRVHWQPKERTFLCPCHMGVFDDEGRVRSGPPPAALPRYDVSVEAENVFVHLPED